MPTYVMLSREQIKLEEEANRILNDIEADCDIPAVSEFKLARRGRFHVSLESLADWAVAPGQAFRDELQFLMSVSEVPGHLRLCVRLWADGYSQAEIASAIRLSQSAVSDRIRRGLGICYDATPISFRRISYHSIYRAPKSHKENTHLTRCVRCGDQFAVGVGYGRYCSLECRQAAHANRQGPRRIVQDKNEISQQC